MYIYFSYNRKLEHEMNFQSHTRKNRKRSETMAYEEPKD